MLMTRSTFPDTVHTISVLRHYKFFKEDYKNYIERVVKKLFIKVLMR